MIVSRSIWGLILVVVLLAAGRMNGGEGLLSAWNLPAAETELSEHQNTERDALPESDAVSGLDEYIKSVRDQSDLIKASLENDPLTQTEMNMKSQELSELWDDALGSVLEELKKSLPEEKWALLQEEQRIWITNRESLSKEAGKGFEGGSIYSLIVNMEAARLTEERVYALHELLPH